MKAIKTVLLSLSLIPMLAWGESVAVLDIENAIRASQQAVTFREKLQAEFSGEQQRLRALSEEGNKLKEKAQKEADFLSKDERQKLMDQIQAKYQEFQQLGSQLKQQSQQREQAFLEGLRPRVEEILKALVEERKIDVILNKKALVYANPSLDLTPQVVEQLNKLQ